ncbi:unnamed protein product [Rhizoctonia solani]|uniref:Protein kinase domain-containing protein n=1 Tax=Rhizoctonia solani TaxID=456999 RepID=A0A8H3D5Z4_9AGAM|nr:unnamed protein product [Rhizoctonia solani]
MANILVQHGVSNITDQLDLKRRCSQPFANGGFGSIYQGELQDGRLVAIKHIDLRSRGELGPGGKRCKHAAHEMYTWSKCEHRGVLKAHGFALSEEEILLVSPLMQNGSLTNHLMCSNTGDRLRFCIDLVSAVEYLHAQGIVHGDIKADNVLVSDSREVQLVDFGNATLVQYLSLLFTRTSPQFACSIRFTAPEIMDGSNKKNTTQSDVYALGMTILQILTGQLPYAGEPDFPALAKIFRGVPPPRSHLDGILRNQYAEDKLWDLLLRCWTHEPNLRPTMTQVKQVLVEVEQESSP